MLGERGSSGMASEGLGSNSGFWFHETEDFREGHVFPAKAPFDSTPTGAGL